MIIEIKEQENDGNENKAYYKTDKTTPEFTQPQLAKFIGSFYKNKNTVLEERLEANNADPESERLDANEEEDGLK